MNIIEIILLVYTVIYILSHTTMIVYANKVINKYFKNKKDNKVSNHKCSIVVSAFNEDKIIVDSTKSLLKQNYPNFEVIIVNDGSTDDTLENLIKAYDLKKVIRTNDKVFKKNHKAIIDIYENPKLKLSVIDKENGGLSDGQNAGVQLASGNIKLNDKKRYWRNKEGSSKYVLITDADCMLEKDAIYKMVQKMEEDPNNVAVGSIIQMSNSCSFNDGDIIKKCAPNTTLGKAQLLEYLKAYFVSRVAMEPIKTTICASGGIGLFKTEALIKVNGFKLKSLAEDMDITMRLHKYSYENDLQWKQTFMPEITCWTEVPETLGMMYKQRLRWGAGMMQSLWEFRKTFFNVNYERFGMISFPFVVFFNWLTPIVEIFGLSYFIYKGATGHDWSILLMFIILNYIFGVSFNLVVMRIENKKLKAYDKKNKIKMKIFSFLEPIFYHWICSAWSVLGYVKYMIGNLKHPKIKRKGF